MLWSKFFQEYGAAFRLVNVEKGYRKIPIPPPSAIFTDHKLGEGFIQLCPWEGEYLFAAARRAKLGIVEVGQFKGGSTFLLANAAPKSVPIYSIDLAPQDDEKLKRLFEATNESSLKKSVSWSATARKAASPRSGLTTFCLSTATTPTRAAQPILPIGTSASPGTGTCCSTTATSFRSKTPLPISWGGIRRHKW